MNGTFTERQLEERIKTLKNDKENIAKVYVANTNKTLQEVISTMDLDTPLTPEEAIRWKLISEIKSDLYPTGSEVIEINE